MLEAKKNPAGAGFWELAGWEAARLQKGKTPPKRGFQIGCGGRI